MNGCHKSAYNVELFMQYFYNRSEAVCRAGSVGNNIVCLRVICFFIDAHNNRCVIIFARCCDNNLFHSSLDMLSGADFIFQLACGFYNDFNTILAPVQMLRITILENMNTFAFNDQIVAVNFYLFIKSSVNSIVFKKVSSCFNPAWIVNSNDFQIVPLQHAAKYESSNSAKSINSDFNHDLCNLLLSLFHLKLVEVFFCRPLHQ